MTSVGKNVNLIKCVVVSHSSSLTISLIMCSWTRWIVFQQRRLHSTSTKFAEIKFSSCMLVAIVACTLARLSFLYKNGCYVIDGTLYHKHSGCMAFIDLSPQAFARVLSCNNCNILYSPWKNSGESSTNHHKINTRILFVNTCRSTKE